MTYIPLHHKYRPQTFAELVGQEAIATTLSNALQQQRIAPAYLFTGARGTGKTSSARILAKSLNCLSADVPTATPCGVCEVCRAIALGSALDVIEIDAASNTGVDNIRELIERAQFAPVQCRYKVYAIDECHMLSTAAFNALLKTLEEPPDRVVFVLATTDPQRVLPTIISRCQRFDFRRIPLDAMVQHLHTIADKEAIAIADEAITLVGQLSQGGLRDAESLLDQLSLLAGEVTVERVWDLVGAVPERDLMSLLEAIAQDNPEALLDSTRRLLDRGREPMIVLQNFASFYRDLLIAKTAPSRSDLVALTAATWQTLCQFAQQLDTTTILAGQQHLRSCEGQLKNTTQPRLWLEVALMGLLPSALNQLAITQPVSLPVAQSPPILALPPMPAPPISSAPPPIAAAVTILADPAPELTPVKPVPLESVAAGDRGDALPPASQPPEPNTSRVWQELLKALKQPSTQMLLNQQGCLLKLTSQEAVIGITERWHKNIKDKLPMLEAALERVLSQKVQLRLEVISPTDAKTATQAVTSADDPPPKDSGNPPSPQPHLVAAPAIAPPNQTSTQAQTPTSVESNPSFAKSSSNAIPPELLPPKKLAEPPNSGNSWQEDEVTSAAKQLAEFFGGKVVDSEIGVEPDVQPQLNPSQAVEDVPTQVWEGAIEDEDDDIPF